MADVAEALLTGSDADVCDGESGVADDSEDRAPGAADDGPETTRDAVLAVADAIDDEVAIRFVTAEEREIGRAGLVEDAALVRHAAGVTVDVTTVVDAWIGQRDADPAPAHRQEARRVERGRRAGPGVAS